jgi:hypothetical protein
VLVPTPDPSLEPTGTHPPAVASAALTSALDEQSRLWGAGQPARVEDLLDRHPALASDPEAVLELVYHEVELRRQRGERPDPGEYQRRFPALAGPLRALLEVEGALRAADLPSESTQDAGARTPAPAGGAAAGPAPPPPRELERLGPYRLLGVLGEGGMGTVYLAEDTRLGRRVALKTVRPGVATQHGARDRFLREARAAAALGEHDHVVPVYHVDEVGGVPFLAMPVLQGEALEDYLRREGRLPVAEAVRVAREAAEGLACAHAAGLVHRDVKPGNIWVGPPPARRVRVLDFGLARLAEGGGGLTQSGAVVGTAGYLAPEQADAGEVGPRADVFGLGAVLYRMLTGRMPFPGPTMLRYLGALSKGPPPPPREVDPEVPATLSDLVQSMLARDPAGRPASAREVAEALGRAAEALGRAAEGRADATPTPAVDSGMKADYGDSKEARQLVAEADKVFARCSCGQELVARAKFAGTRVRCPACEEFVHLPGELRLNQPPAEAWREAVTAGPPPGGLRSVLVRLLVRLLVLALLAALGGLLLDQVLFWMRYGIFRTF